MEEARIGAAGKDQNFRKGDAAQGIDAFLAPLGQDDNIVTEAHTETIDTFYHSTFVFTD
jgi:hypothetical protein